ncbi:hypothetical protein FHW68_003660 [Pseudomonas sp. Tn43]|nr:hypothetical protein [Pseudomonas sp. Tn43]
MERLIKIKLMDDSIEIGLDMHGKTLGMYGRHLLDTRAWKAQDIRRMRVSLRGQASLLQGFVNAKNPL